MTTKRRKYSIHRCCRLLATQTTSTIHPLFFKRGFEPERRRDGQTSDNRLVARKYQKSYQEHWNAAKKSKRGLNLAGDTIMSQSSHIDTHSKTSRPLLPINPIQAHLLGYTSPKTSSPLHFSLQKASRSPHTDLSPSNSSASSDRMTENSARKRFCPTYEEDRTAPDDRVRRAIQRGV